MEFRDAESVTAEEIRKRIEARAHTKPLPWTSRRPLPGAPLLLDESVYELHDEQLLSAWQGGSLLEGVLELSDGPRATGRSDA